MSLSLNNGLLFIRGVSSSRLSVNAITHFHLGKYPRVHTNQVAEWLINKGLLKVGTEERLNSSGAFEMTVLLCYKTRCLAAVLKLITEQIKKSNIALCAHRSQPCWKHTHELIGFMLSLKDKFIQKLNFQSLSAHPRADGETSERSKSSKHF